MPYYEFFVYSSRRRRLIEIQETLVNLWEFDPNSVRIARTVWPRWEHRIAARLLTLVGLPDRKTWTMVITGPEIHRERVYTVAAAWESFCDGGGYDFGYDPYAYYSDEDVRRHTVAWDKRNQDAMDHYLETLSPEERARIRATREQLLGHVMAQEDDED